MKRFLKAYYPRSSGAHMITWSLLIIAGCHVDSDFSTFKTHFLAPEKLALNSFTNYVRTLSSADFPLASFQFGSQLYNDPVYTEKIQSDKDLQFFPAILWQIYTLTGEADWKHLAENYSRALCQDHIMEDLAQAEAIPYVYLAQYLADRDQDNKAALLSALSRYIAENETNKTLNYDPDTNNSPRIERLLENRLLFMASKESGDPIYAQLAQQHSELIFEHYFQNRHSRALFYALANCKTLPDITKLHALQTEDFYHLALIFYGFTILNDRQENERYHALCLRLAELFSSIFADADPDEGAVHLSGEPPARKVDVLSKTLICLALHRLNDTSGKPYRETVRKLFDRALDELDQSDERTGQYSFRVYYYLFEFFTENNSL